MLDNIESDKGKLVVLYLKIVKSATIDEIKSELNLSYLETYPILRKLESKEIVETIEPKKYQIKATIQ